MRLALSASALSASALAALLVMAGAHGASYEPPSVADEPQAEEFEPIHLMAIAEGGCTGSGRTWVPVGKHHECWDVPSLGVKAVRKGRR